MVGFGLSMERERLPWVSEGGTMRAVLYINECEKMF
jgi:hypothetical protein